MSMRSTNVDWSVEDDKGNVPTWERVGVAVLMDIRSELRKLNALLSCPNFTRIPLSLSRIAANTTKKKKAKAKP